MELKNFIFRIDDRLIHGQVTVGWIIPLELKRVYVVDDLADKDEFLKQLWLDSLPENTILKVFNLEDFKKKFNSLNFNNSILLVPSIEMAYKIIKFYPITNEINIGGLHYSHGKIGVLPWFFVTDSDIEFLKKLLSRGIIINIQMVINSKKILVNDKFIKKLELLWAKKQK